MQSAPTYHLSSLSPGPAGIRETLRAMSHLKKAYKKAPAIRELACSLTKGLPQKAFRAEVSRIHAFVRDKIRYLKDIKGIETLQTPIQTLRLGQGDCDDKSVLAGALLESIGHPVRFVAVGMAPDIYQHVFPQTKIGGKWVTVETTENWPLGRHPKGVKAFMVQND